MYNVSDTTSEGPIDEDRSAGFDDARRHLDPVVDHLDHKFADAPTDHVAEVVKTAFEELTAEATIPDHLAALTQHHAHQQLAAEATAGITTPDDDPDGPRADGSAELPE
jgi:hypothetical protein